MKKKPSSERQKIFVKELINWLQRGRCHYLTFLVIILTSLYLFRIINIYPKLIGFVFSSIGIIVLLWQLMQDAKKYTNQKPNTIPNWIKSFPKIKSHIIYAKADIFLEDVTIKATARVYPPDSEPLEGKVVYLLNQVNNLQNQIDSIEMKITNLDESQNSIKKECISKVTSLEESMNNLIAYHSIGDYDINLFGIIITICGLAIEFSL